MIERRGREFGLSRFGQIPVKAEHLTQGLELKIDDLPFFLLRVPGALFEKLLQPALFFAVGISEPHEIEQNLKVEKILRVETAHRLADLLGVGAVPAAVQQLGVPGVRLDDGRPIVHEEIGENKFLVVGRQIGGGFQRQLEKRVLDAGILGVFPELIYKGRGEVESLADLGEFGQQGRHVVISLGGVQPDPGERVAAGQFILIRRLVHVPNKGDRDRLHHPPPFRRERLLRAKISRRPPARSD
jgi:hypothetical protein